MALFWRQRGAAGAPESLTRFASFYKNKTTDCTDACPSQYHVRRGDCWPLWNNPRSPGVSGESRCGCAEERTGLTAAGRSQRAGGRAPGPRFPPERAGLSGAMASEVVCGLVFRLLLPVCLAAGEFWSLLRASRPWTHGHVWMCLT